MTTKERREAAGLTQEQLAAKAHLSTSLLRYHEGGYELSEHMKARVEKALLAAEQQKEK
jgi:transcriptional regulator with XRE-family HTH domain